MRAVRILHLEDDPLDAELIREHLRAECPGCEIVRVADHEKFLAELDADQDYDVVLSDYILPGFDGIDALRAVRERSQTQPFLFVSGAIGEERAIESLKRGATDYVIKDRLDRLGPAMQRALAEADQRRQRRKAEAMLRKRNRQLAESDRRKDEFLAMLAHELRNPLAPILTAAEMLACKPDRDAMLTDALEVIQRQVRHMARLLDDLLDVSRFTRGKIKLRKEPVSVDRIVERALETCGPVIRSHGHELTVEAPERPLSLLADSQRVEQVLVNLLNNAAKYTKPRGRIRLSAERVDDAVEFRVRDNGIGIAPETLPTIFDLFAQSDRSLDRSEGGLGLGLALVRGLVEMHGGSVEVHSDGLDQGTEFTVRLPLLADDAETNAETIGAGSRAAPAATKARMCCRMLIVDDNADAVEMMRQLLEIEGHEVHVAADGESGLLAAQAIEPDVILLDIGLPGLDGYEVARRLRQMPTLRHALLVAATGYGNPADLRRSSDAGFDHHLVKPINLADLQRLMTTHDHGNGVSIDNDLVHRS